MFFYKSYLYNYFACTVVCLSFLPMGKIFNDIYASTYADDSMPLGYKKYCKNKYNKSSECKCKSKSCNPSISSNQSIFIKSSRLWGNYRIFILQWLSYRYILENLILKKEFVTYKV